MTFVKMGLDEHKLLGIEFDGVNFFEGADVRFDDNDDVIPESVTKNGLIEVDAKPSGATFKVEDIPKLITFLETIYNKQGAAK